jgi:microcystin degradation protein MlrC
MIGLYLTPFEPMRTYVDDMILAEKRDGVLGVSLAHCFPWADVPSGGTQALIVTDGNVERA